MVSAAYSDKNNDRLKVPIYAFIDQAYWANLEDRVNVWLSIFCSVCISAKTWYGWLKRHQWTIHKQQELRWIGSVIEC